jgi:hypothetical protein
MKLLDWIKNRNRADSSVDSQFDPKAHGHENWRGVFAEIRHDESLARARNETGCEPPSATNTGNTPDAKTQQKKQPRSWER